MLISVRRRFHFNVGQTNIYKMYIMYLSFCPRHKRRRERERKKTRTHTTINNGQSIKNAICNHIKKLICRPAHLVRYLFSCFCFIVVIAHWFRTHTHIHKKKCERKKVHVKSKNFTKFNMSVHKQNHECIRCTKYKIYFLRKKKKRKQIMTRYCR